MNPERLVAIGGSSAVLRREAWDCDQLGLEAAKVERTHFQSATEAEAVLQAVVQLARPQYRHLAARVASTDRLSAAAFQTAGFRFVDCVVHLSLELNKPLPKDDAGTRLATPADTQGIGAMSASAFSDADSSFNRYLNDGGFSVEQVRRVYRVWGETSVGGPAADGTWCAIEAGELVGFLTFKNPDQAGVARIPLNAVEKQFRGKGIYRRLVLRALNDLREQGARRVEITTQLQQLAVQRTWLRLGASVVASSFSFHSWL